MQTRNSTSGVFAVQVIRLQSHKEFTSVYLVVFCFSGLPATFGLLTACLSPIFFSFLFFSPPENPLSECVKLGSVQYSGGICGRRKSAESKRFQRGRFTTLDNKLSLGCTLEKGVVRYFVCLNMIGISQKGEVTHIFKMSVYLTRRDTPARVLWATISPQGRHSSRHVSCKSPGVAAAQTAWRGGGGGRSQRSTGYSLTTRVTAVRSQLNCQPPLPPAAAAPSHCATFPH